jgi:hypothetical protein
VRSRRAWRDGSSLASTVRFVRRQGLAVVATVAQIPDSVAAMQGPDNSWLTYLVTYLLTWLGYNSSTPLLIG